MIGYSLGSGEEDVQTWANVFYDIGHSEAWNEVRVAYLEHKIHEAQVLAEPCKDASNGGPIVEGDHRVRQAVNQIVVQLLRYALTPDCQTLEVN